MKKRRFIDLLPSYLLSDVPEPLRESNYKSDSSRCVRRTSKNLLKLRKMLKWTFPLRFGCFSGMHRSRFGLWNKPTALCSCSFALLWVVCVSTLLIPRGGCCWPMGSWDSFFQREGSRWSDEIRVTFGWPLLDKDSLHQLSSVILRCFYVMGAFVGFSAEQHTFRLTLRDLLLNLVG